MKKAVLLLCLTSLWSFHACAVTFYGADKLQHAPRTRAASYYVQVGSFKREAYALEAKSKYQSYGFPIEIVRHGEMYAVIVGPIEARKERWIASPTARNDGGASRNGGAARKDNKAAPKDNGTAHKNGAPSFLVSIFQPKPKAPEKRPVVASYTVARHYPRLTTTPVQTRPTNPNWASIGQAQPMKKRGVQGIRAYPLIDVERLKDNIPITDPQWYLQLAGDIVFHNLPSSMTVRNGSPYRAPYDVDTFSIDQSTMRGGFIAGFGRAIPFDCYYLTRYAIGVRYQYLPKQDITGTITQYSLPQFLNYNYTWGADANVLTADLTLNFTEWRRFSPYFNVGVGYAVTGANAYTETAIPPVTPRYSPAFAANSSHSVTYHLGAGLDYAVASALHLSVGYEFLALGKYQSGYGLDTWSAERLDLGNYNANTLLIGLTYFMG